MVVVMIGEGPLQILDMTGISGGAGSQEGKANGESEETPEADGNNSRTVLPGDAGALDNFADVFVPDPDNLGSFGVDKTKRYLVLPHL